MRPDLVLINKETGEVEIFELTSCADRDTNIAEAERYKTEKYSPLVADIEKEADYKIKASFKPFEVCSLGNIPTKSRQVLRSLVGKTAARATLRKLSKISISCSQYIFNSRRSLEWAAPKLFEKRVYSVAKAEKE